MPEFVGAVDQETTSTRFVIFDHAGNELAKHQLEHHQILPRSGWVALRPGGDLGAHRHGYPERPSKRRVVRCRPESDRHHQPARDDSGLGPAYRPPLLAGSPAIYALEGSIAVTGAAVQWLRDQMKVIGTAAERVSNLPARWAKTAACTLNLQSLRDRE